MANVRVILNTKEVSRQILKGEGTKDYLRRIADRVADQSGLACNVDVYVGTNRANASVGVEPGSEDYYRNLHTNALASALY